MLLQKLEEAEVIEIVQGPTDWVFNIVQAGQDVWFIHWKNFATLWMVQNTSFLCALHTTKSLRQLTRITNLSGQRNALLPSIISGTYWRIKRNKRNWLSIAPDCWRFLCSIPGCIFRSKPDFKMTGRSHEHMERNSQWTIPSTQTIRWYFSTAEKTWRNYSTELNVGISLKTSEWYSEISPSQY